MSTSHPINDVPSPTHASRKKQRTSQSLSTRAAPQSGGTLGPRGRKFRQVCKSCRSIAFNGDVKCPLSRLITLFYIHAVPIQ